MKLLPAAVWSGAIPVIAFDMDGVLYNWCKRINELLLHFDPKFPIVQPGERLHFSHLSGVGGRHEYIQLAMTDHRMYLDMEPYAGAIEAVKATYEAGYRVMFLSTPDSDNPSSASNKQEQIRQDFGADAVKHLILSHDKTVVNCDVLVDDKPTITGLVTPSWVRVLPDHSYNKDINTPLRLTSWEEWPTMLEQALMTKRSML